MTSIVPSCLLSGGGPAFRPGKEKIIDSKQQFQTKRMGFTNMLRRVPFSSPRLHISIIISFAFVLEAIQAKCSCVT